MSGMKRKFCIRNEKTYFRGEQYLNGDKSLYVF